MTFGLGEKMRLTETEKETYWINPASLSFSLSSKAEHLKHLEIWYIFFSLLKDEWIFASLEESAYVQSSLVQFESWNSG